MKSNKKRNPVSLKQRVRKAFKITLKVLALIIVVPALAFGVMRLYSTLQTTEHLEIETVEVRGLERVGSDDILALSDIIKGDNILALDISGAVEKIEAHPWVKSVKVTRHLPSTVDIEVTEMKALCLVSLDALYVVSLTGEIFKKYSPEDSLDLPVITGLETEGGPDEGYEVAKAHRDFVGFLAGREGMTISEISEIHVDPVHGYSLYTLLDGVRIELGKEDFEKRLKKLERVVKAGGSLKDMAVVNLTGERGVVVRHLRSAKAKVRKNGKKG